MGRLGDVISADTITMYNKDRIRALGISSCAKFQNETRSLLPPRHLFLPILRKCTQYACAIKHCRAPLDDLLRVLKPVLQILRTWAPRP